LNGEPTVGRAGHKTLSQAAHCVAEHTKKRNLGNYWIPCVTGDRFGGCVLTIIHMGQTAEKISLLGWILATRARYLAATPSKKPRKHKARVVFVEEIFPIARATA